MKEICFEFSGERIWFGCKQLEEILQSINKTVKPAHKKEIKDLLEKWMKLISFKMSFYSFYNDSDYYKVKELLFFYYIRDIMIEKDAWVPIDKPDLSEEDINKLKERAKRYGDYRYDVDNGWIGGLAQDLFSAYLREQGLDFHEYENDMEEGIDEYDILINGIKIDVKCATQDNYMEITPKVKVEEAKKKDYYVAMKYFSDIKKFVIIGYFYHDEFGSYPFKALYGAPFWGVKLYNAKPISELLEKISNE